MTTGQTTTIEPAGTPSRPWPRGRLGGGTRAFRLDTLRVLGILIALGAIWLYFGLSSKYFFTTSNIWTIFLQASNVAIIAGGLTVVMIAAEIDLSIGSVEAFGGAIAAIVVIKYGLPVAVGIACCLAATMLAGAVNGILTSRFRIVSFISTLAMLGVAQGIAFLLTNGHSVAGFPASYDAIGTASIDGFPVAAVIAIGVYVVLHLMLTRTKLGLMIYAVGGNAEAAAYAGIRPGRVKLVALMISGLTSGIGGLILSSRLDAGNGLFGAGDLLQAVAAVVIGGTSLFGGVGNVVGTGIGVVMIASIDNGLVLLNIPDFWQQIVVGAIIVGAMMIDQLTKAARLAVVRR